MVKSATSLREEKLEANDKIKKVLIEMNDLVSPPWGPGVLSHLLLAEVILLLRIRGIEIRVLICYSVLDVAYQTESGDAPV
jgi:hypothetical protein